MEFCSLVVASFGFEMQLALCILGSPDIDLCKKRVQEIVAFHCALAW